MLSNLCVCIYIYIYKNIIYQKIFHFVINTTRHTVRNRYFYISN